MTGQREIFLPAPGSDILQVGNTETKSVRFPSFPSQYGRGCFQTHYVGWVGVYKTCNIFTVLFKGEKSFRDIT